MSVHYCFLSEYVPALVCSITSRAKTENFCFVGCNCGVGVIIFRSNLLFHHQGRWLCPHGRGSIFLWNVFAPVPDYT